jgi:hypothetical protein
MSFKSTKIGGVLFSAGLLLVLLQGLWQLPDLQDYFFPDKYWELKIESANKEDWHVENGLLSLKLRVGYLEWCRAHIDHPQNFSMEWMVHFPISECIRFISPNFAWNINIYIANKTRVGVERKLKNLLALFNIIQLRKNQSLLLTTDNSWLNDDQFDRRFKQYNIQLNDLKNKLNKIIVIGYKNNNTP